MGDKLELGAFGEAYFHNKLTAIRCFGTIVELEPYWVLFRDNDGYEYLVSRRSFTFAKKDFKVKVA